VLRTTDPVELEQLLRQRDAELARQVRTALGPVVAGLARTGRPLDPEVGEEGGARIGEQEDLRLALDQAAVEQRVGDPDSQLARKMAVTGAGGAERTGAVGLAEATNLGAVATSGPARR
jgi:hypothetical protein